MVISDGSIIMNPTTFEPRFNCKMTISAQMLQDLQVIDRKMAGEILFTELMDQVRNTLASTTYVADDANIQNEVAVHKEIQRLKEMLDADNN